MNRIKEIFTKLKEAHPFIRSADNATQIKIVDALQPLIDEAETLGVNKGFCEAILFWGKEFLDYEYGVKKGDSEKLLRYAAQLFHSTPQLMTFGERDASKLAEKENALVYKIKGYTQKEKDKDGKLTGKYTPDIEVLLKKS